MRDHWFVFVLLYAALLAACALAIWFAPNPLRVGLLVFAATVVLLTFLNPAWLYRRLGAACLMFLTTKSAVSAAFDVEAMLAGASGFVAVAGEVLFGTPNATTLVLVGAAMFVCFGLDQLPIVVALLRPRTLDVKPVEHTLGVTVRDDAVDVRLELDVTAVGNAPVFVSDVGLSLRGPGRRTAWVGFQRQHDAGVWRSGGTAQRIEPGSCHRLRVVGTIRSRVPALLRRVPGGFGLASLLRARDIVLLVAVRTSEQEDILCPVTARGTAPPAA